VPAETTLVHQVSLDEGGLDPDALVHLAHRYGLHGEARPFSLDELITSVDQGRFPIVLVDRTFLDREFAIHAVIPIRFTARYVAVLDPLRGERRISRRNFTRACRRVGRWAIVLD